jgi:hypothetical protein
VTREERCEAVVAAGTDDTARSQAAHVAGMGARTSATDRWKVVGWAVLVNLIVVILTYIIKIFKIILTQEHGIEYLRAPPATFFDSSSELSFAALGILAATAFSAGSSTAEGVSRSVFITALILIAVIFACFFLSVIAPAVQWEWTYKRLFFISPEEHREFWHNVNTVWIPNGISLVMVIVSASVASK